MNGSGRTGRVLLTGCPARSGNLGLGALFSSACTLVEEAAPGSGIVLLDYEERDASICAAVGEKEMTLEVIPLRFSKNPFVANNVGILVLFLLLLRLCPSLRLRKAVAGRSGTLGGIMGCDAAMAVTGGDSFSDIYGFWNYLYSTLPLILILLLERPLILLPQTYGPYRSWYARLIARWILARAERIVARDLESREDVRALIGEERTARTFASSADMAFRLEPSPLPLPHPVPGLASAKGACLIGFNASGLLYMGGYSRRNQFALLEDYPSLVGKILDALLIDPGNRVLLIPHVLGEQDESDPRAIRLVVEALSPALRGRVLVLTTPLNPGQTKSLIGACDFFVGSRMHACIAALSQGIPAVGLAYSKKFVGVFGRVGAAELALDLRTTDAAEAVLRIGAALAARDGWRSTIERRGDSVRRDLATLFSGFFP